MNTAGPRRLCPVRQHSLQTPDLIAIRAPRQVLTYRQLDRQLGAVQQQLAASGLQPGDHLASIGANSLALILLAWGCLRAGLVFCPLNSRQPRAQLHAQLQQLDAYYRINKAKTFAEWESQLARLAILPAPCVLAHAVHTMLRAPAQ